jgi:hypothetical protein
VVAEQVGHPAGAVGHAQDAAGHHLVQVGAEGRHGRRDPLLGQPQQLGRDHRLPVEGLTAGVVEPANGQALEQQEAVDQAGVHPQQQVGVAGVVAQAGHRVDPLDAAVDVVDPVGVGLRPTVNRLRPARPGRSGYSRSSTWA